MNIEIGGFCDLSMRGGRTENTIGITDGSAGDSLDRETKRRCYGNCVVRSPPADITCMIINKNFRVENHESAYDSHIVFCTPSQTHKHTNTSREFEDNMYYTIHFDIKSTVTSSFVMIHNQPPPLCKSFLLSQTLAFFLIIDPQTSI
jgi:hypothetical protein